MFFGTECHICQKVTSATYALRIRLVIDIGMYTRLMGICLYPVCNMSSINAHRRWNNKYGLVFDISQMFFTW